MWLILVFTIGFNWIFGLVIERTGKSRAHWALVATGVAVNVLLLAVFKYANFIAANLHGVQAGAWPALPPIHLPIGISFFTFQAISYLLDVARHDVTAERNPVTYGAYKAFFPQLIAGPIVRYRDVRKEFHGRRLDIDDVVSGISRFVIGLAKKVLIADVLAKPVETVMALPHSQLSFAAAWFGVVCFALQIYFDFSGYSDMAIGMGRMFGFHFRENFDYPYVARSIGEFWRRWHISLSSWFRDYLYIPLGGNRNGKFRTVGNLLLVMALCGLWHGANWTFVCWGLFHGILLAVEYLGLATVIAPVPAIGRAYTLIVLTFGWAIFRSENLGQVSNLWAAMAGAGTATDIPPWYDLLPNDVLAAIVVGMIGATGVTREISKRLAVVAKGQTASAALPVLRFVFLSAIFYASVLSVAAVGFNPFIYFRF